MGRKRKARPRGRPRSQSAPAVLHSPHKKKRKQWSNESMLLAMEAVKNGTPIQRATRLHGVPRTTLRDRASGRVKHGKKPGPTPYLSVVEGKELASFITDVAKAGYGKSRQEIKRIAEDVASDKGVVKK